MVILGPVTAAYDNPENSPSFYYRWYAGGTYAGGTSATYTPVAADAGKTLTCRVYAVGFAGYKESAATAAVAAFVPPSSTALTNSFIGGNLATTDQADWYSFTPSSGSEVIAWEHNGASSTTGWIRVSAYKSDGTVIFENDSSTPSIAVGNAGLTVDVRVSYYITLGTYNIRYQ
jgi:hypothetical protein